MKRPAAKPPKVALDIVQAMDGPFGALYQGPSWDNWRAILRAAFGLPLTEEQAAFVGSVAGNRALPGRRVRELVIAAGRRAGKDAITALICAWFCLTYRPDGRVRAGERPLILLLAADRSQARNLLRYVRGLFDLPGLKPLLTRETADGFELANGLDIFVGTSDWRTVRGRTILLCVLNELSFWRDETSANPDKEVYRAILPATASLGDKAMIVMISSVHRRAGLLYERWSKFYGTNDPNVFVVQARTRQLNPLIDQQFINDARSDDPQAAAAEYDSEWRDDIAGYITRPEIEACVDFGLTVRPPQPGVRFTAWVDASSGQSRDSFCCSVGHMENDIRVIDTIIEVVPPFDPAVACAQICATLRSYNIRETVGDRWALGFVQAEFQRHGIVLNYSDKNRSDIYREALPAIRSRRVRFVDNAKMVNQFVNLERRVLPGGGERIDHPQRSGHHDDISVVVAGCLIALATPSPAENWIEYYRRLSDAHLADIDRDAITAPPNFGFSFSSGEAWVTLNVPDVIAREGSVLRGGDGNDYGFRWFGTKATVDIFRKHATALLKNPAWRSLNEAKARELIGGEA
jgi:hypothetical protein